jgi:hypothetical protein
MPELQKIVKKSKTKKAPGDDDITNEVIMNFSITAGEWYLTIINRSLSFRHFSNAWKLAKVIPILKSGKSPRKPENFRPISLLCNLGKKYEEVILSRQEEHIETNHCLPDEQYGFRRQHSTTQQLLNVADRITHGFNSKLQTAAVSLDISKAFDKVWHTGLIFKMINLKFPDYLILITHSYLENRSFYVYRNKAKSTIRPIRAGVPQGSCLGPTLFNIYTHDIPRSFPHTTLALFADDAALISQSSKTDQAIHDLQTALNTVATWYRIWRIEINPSKTQAIMFTHKRNSPEIDLTLHGKTIQWSNSIKYLGLTLDKKLSWNQHVDSVYAKANGKLASLYPLLRSKFLSQEAKLMIYKTVIRPTFAYAAPIWSGCNDTSLKKLQVLQNKAIRSSLKANIMTKITDLHESANIPYVIHYLQELSIKFYENILHSKVPHISHLPLKQVRPQDKYKRPIASLRDSASRPQKRKMKDRT